MRYNKGGSSYLRKKIFVAVAACLLLSLLLLASRNDIRAASLGELADWATPMTGVAEIRRMASPSF